MKNYIELLKDIKQNGVLKESRSGDTLSVFGRQLRWNMDDGFPLMTLKKVSFHNIAHELLWFLGAFDDEWKKFGNTNIRYLVDHNVHIWNDDAYRGYLNKIHQNGNFNNLTFDEFYNAIDQDMDTTWAIDNIHSKKSFIELIKNDDEFALKFGELGDSYGAQWRRWKYYKRVDFVRGKFVEKQKDQIQNVIDRLKSSPLSRRHIVTAWNPEVVDELTLPPCHYGFTLNVQPLSEKERMKLYRTGDYSDGGVKLIGGTPSHKWINDYSTTPKYKLSLKWNQRSVDSPLGLPYNITSYATLLYVISHFTNMVPNDLICSLEDTHIYTNQLCAVDKLIEREDELPPLPTFELVNMENVKTIDDIRFDNFQVNDYHPLSKVKAPLSVGL